MGVSKMIKLYDAKLTDSIPRIMAEQPWSRAISKAVEKQHKRIIDFADRVMLYANIDNLSSEILDIIAVEMKVQAYSESYNISLKRTLIKGAIMYWSKAGTKKAVANICTDIFGDAEVQEWFDYGGRAGYFKVSTANPSITEDNVNDFKAAIESVKRCSAWLETVELVLSTDAWTSYTGFAVHTADTIILTQK